MTLPWLKLLPWGTAALLAGLCLAQFGAAHKAAGRAEAYRTIAHESQAAMQTRLKIGAVVDAKYEDSIKVLVKKTATSHDADKVVAHAVEQATAKLAASLDSTQRVQLLVVTTGYEDRLTLAAQREQMIAATAGLYMAQRDSARAQLGDALKENTRIETALEAEAKHSGSGVWPYVTGVAVAVATIVTISK